MTTSPNHIELAVVDGRATIRGDIDLRSSGDIAAWLASFDEGPLDVDFSAVTFFDSTGLRTILNARRRNAGIRIVNPSKSVWRILEVTGTTEYLMNSEDDVD